MTPDIVDAIKKKINYISPFKKVCGNCRSYRAPEMRFQYTPNIPSLCTIDEVLGPFPVHRDGTCDKYEERK